MWMGRTSYSAYLPTCQRLACWGKHNRCSRPLCRSPGQATHRPQPQMNQYMTQPSASRPPLTEQATLLYIEGIGWTIAASRQGSGAGNLTASPEPLATNETAIQCSVPHEEFIVVTNVGGSHLLKCRTLDYLRDALEIQREAYSQS